MVNPASRNLEPKRLYGLPEKGMVVFTFDDGNTSDYTVAYPLMSARNMVGTIYMVGDDTARSNLLTGLALSWDQAREMYNAGWDIECHTDTHPHLHTLNEVQLRTQMQNVNNKFQAENLPVPMHHAFPYGGQNGLVRQVLKEFRLHTLRGYVGAAQTYLTANFDKLTCFDAAMYDRTNLEATKAAIEKATKENKIIILMIHQLHQTGRSQLFEELLDFVLTCDIDVVPITEMYARINQYRGAL